jgi:uncharacterized protein
MKLIQHYGFTVLVITLAVLVQIGCARTQPARFYALTTIPEVKAITPTNLSLNAKRIGVGPVEIPSYLDRPQIVTHQGHHQIHLAELDRWAGTLRENIKSVIAENLSILLYNDHVYSFPWRSVKPIQYQIMVQILRFDAVPGEMVILDARWVLMEEDPRRMLVEQRSQIQIPLSSKEYNEIVAAQSQAVGKLSREIAAAIQTLPE